MATADIRSVIPVFIAMMVPSLVAVAETPAEPNPFHLDPCMALVQDAAASVPASPAGSPSSSSPTETPAAQLQKFGAQNTLRLNLEGAWIYDFDSANMVQGRVGLAWFFVDNVELDLLLSVDYVNQPGTDAVGGGFDMQLRWHILAFEEWSFFVELGGGVLGTSHSVPSNGSCFNFTPNAGIGVTFALDPSTRLYIGADWFHISNAGTFARNPGRDSMELWMGISFQL